MGSESECSECLYNAHVRSITESKFHHHHQEEEEEEEEEEDQEDEGEGDEDYPASLKSSAAATIEREREQQEREGPLEEEDMGSMETITIPIAGQGMSFEEIGIKATALLQSIKKTGYQLPTSVQETSTPVLLSGGNAIINAFTGSGKTAAYLVPIIEQVICLREPLIPTPRARASCSGLVCWPVHIVISSSVHVPNVEFHSRDCLRDRLWGEARRDGWSRTGRPEPW
jgi:hypothetical protein